MKDYNSIQGIFPCPIYLAKRDSVLDSTEEKEIEDIVKEGIHRNKYNSSSNNNYIFNGKLKNIKQFCEQQLKIYVEQVIAPKEELDFYITQSWLNVTKPGGYHHEHFHPNSIISGVFYVSTEEDDNITFVSRMKHKKEVIKIEPKVSNTWNCTSCNFFVNTNDLILFPSWLNHRVGINKKATKDRISISFNVFVRGTLGIRNDKSELIL